MRRFLVACVLAVPVLYACGDSTAACTVSEVLNANRGQRPCTLRYLGP